MDREREKEVILYLFLFSSNIYKKYDNCGNMSNFKCVIINNWYNSLLNILVGNRGNYIFF